MVVDILFEIKAARGANRKKEILSENSSNELLKKILLYASNPFTPFNVVKIPKTSLRVSPPGGTEEQRFDHFFRVADCCIDRSITGNDAIRAMSGVFSSCTEKEEAWMRKILKKHLAIGASTRTINKVFENLVPTFEVSLAQKFEMKRTNGWREIAVEPKLDGIRCFSVVKDGTCMMFARSGKLITNFSDTLAPELLKLGDGCYDGELMGEDFTAIMRQAYRKEGIDLKGTYISLFDFLPLEEWESGLAKMSCEKRYEELLDRLTDSYVDLEMIRPTERFHVDCDDYSQIKKAHDEFVEEGFEGAMIKDPDAPYRFGRGFEVMKLKAFHDADLVIHTLTEGTGKYSGQLGSVTCDFNGVDVSIGSGFDDDLRKKMWSDRESFVGRMIEVRYQEVTPDGSLRFPVFICFRSDRDE